MNKIRNSLIVFIIVLNLNICRLRLKQCLKFSCQCLSSDLAMAAKINCPNSGINDCFVKHGICEASVDGSCGWKFNTLLKDCLNRQNYCHSTCGKCYDYSQAIIMMMCMKSSTIDCYNNYSHCQVNETGNCQWNENQDLQNCLNAIPAVNP